MSKVNVFWNYLKFKIHGEAKTRVERGPLHFTVQPNKLSQLEQLRQTKTNSL